MRSVLISCLLFLCCQIHAQNRPTYFDGPYIQIAGDSLQCMWIDSGELNVETTLFEDDFIFNVDDLPLVHIHSSHTPPDSFRLYENVPKFVAISDIHGQHALFIKLLRAHQVIDKNEHWNYGNGHLVVLGDIMDRGDGVTESLWFLYALEQQAIAAGGRVHTLLGNHELMVMHGNIGYIHPKYRYTSGVSQIPYPALFNSTTILGRWLRSKNITTVINNIGFVHGGFSKKVLAQENSLSKLNSIFKNDILPKSTIKKDSSDFASLLYFENGPLWYRGYSDPESFDRITAHSILNQLALDRLVVGHTSMPNITSLHHGKIILIDSSIQFGKSGEVLVFENDTLYRGLLSGEKKYLGKTGESTSSSLFNHLHDFEDPALGFLIDTDLGLLTGKNRLAEIYQPAEFIVRDSNQILYRWNIELRSRGNARKKVCHLPPLKLKMAKSDISTAGFNKNNKLKLVLPCGSAYDQQALFREYVIYKMYELIGEYYMQTRLINVDLFDKGKSKYQVKGFIIEDENEFCVRTGVNILTSGNVADAGLHRDSYLEMIFFQYMILNTDFGIKNKHNLEIIAIPGKLRTRAIPYDFDCAGMVNQTYAVPHHSFPLDHVRQRLFRGKEINRQELVEMKTYYNNIRSTLESIVDQANYLSGSSMKLIKKDIADFYKILNNQKKWKSHFRVVE